MTTLSHGLRKAMGEQVSVAACLSGSEALSLLGDQAFDVIISDYNMPGTSGLELLERIREQYGEMALVLITAYGTDALEEGVHQLGGVYMTKPFEPSFLVQTIRDLIRTRETKGSTEGVSHLMDSLGKPAGSSTTVNRKGLAT